MKNNLRQQIEDLGLKVASFSMKTHGADYKDPVIPINFADQILALFEKEMGEIIGGWTESRQEQRQKLAKKLI